MRKSYPCLPLKPFPVLFQIHLTLLCSYPRYTSAFLPHIILPLLPPPPPFSPQIYFPLLFLTLGTFPYLIPNTPYTSLFLPQVHLCHLCLLTLDPLPTLTCCDKIVIVSMIESEEDHKGQRLPCCSIKRYTAKPARSRKVLWRAQRWGT